MATRKQADETAETAAQPNPAAVRTQEYAAGTGWEVGQSAPSDAYRALDGAGTGEPTGPVVHTHPGGYARQIVAKGGLVTAGVKRELDAEASDTEQG
ncbi:hypothetical protein RM863_12810 [Streptomyces sp. DSM 41014]|uniref:Uncharacterized protein n=1 Tax=Streptomyces hintoniae TaxID=3075521 RepID=A0ABU2UIT2_9ACTN|nr:hypothetical protein [Streptomyces sp. DSM 41014]MDT0473005.1 hypothetical protein [Streptomyces sp. DSM 41014]